jgi:hypothetical protein
MELKPLTAFGRITARDPRIVVATNVHTMSDLFRLSPEINDNSERKPSTFSEAMHYTAPTAKRNHAYECDNGKRMAIVFGIHRPVSLPRS